MSIRYGQALQISVRLCLQVDLVLNLLKGFPSPIHLWIKNDAEYLATYAVPSLTHFGGKADIEKIDIVRALVYGILEIWDEMGSKVSNNYAAVLKLPELLEITWFFNPYEQILYPLANPPYELLRLFRSNLKTGKKLCLHLWQKNPEDWSAQAKCNTELQGLASPLSKLVFRDSSAGIPFSEIPGTPIPRFTIAMSSASFICSLSATPRFWITLTVTSISELHITIGLCLDKYMTTTPQSIT